MNNKIKKILSRISVLLVITQIGSCTVMDAASKTWEVIKDPSIKVGEDKDQKSKFALSIYADKKVNINEYSDSDDLDEEKEEKGNSNSEKNDDDGLHTTADICEDNEDCDSSGVDVDTIKKRKQKSSKEAGEEQATPISIKIIQLKDDSLFMSADYSSLEKDLKGSLGKTYLDHDEYIIDPKQFKYIDFSEVDEDTHYIAVLAFYRDYNNVKWRDTIKIKAKAKEYSFLVRLLEKKVEIKKEN